MIIRHPELNFFSLTRRFQTDMIVIHHTGGKDIDASAAQIHEWHISQGWTGIGYHFVIRKDGTVEVGRPEWAVGSHAYGENYHTLGIHISGDFETAQPTPEQIAACSELVADLCRDYDIPRDREHIVGHCDLMATDCPGKNLYARLDEIIADNHAVPVTNIFDLVKRYETCGDPANITDGFGAYQFTRTTADKFVEWLKNYPDDKLANYGRHLAKVKNFAGEWQMLGTVDPGHFGELQDKFAFEYFYRDATLLFAKENFHPDKHSVQLQAVIFSIAIQQGIYACVNLFKHVCRHPNLSYVDDARFDRELIADVYDFLIEHPRDTGSDILRNRLRQEKEDALC